MANDIQDRIGQILGSDSARALAGTAVTEALKAFGSQRSQNGAGGDGAGAKLPGKGLSGVRGLAAGAGAAAVAPVAAKGIGKLIKANGVKGVTEGLSGGPKKLVEGAASKLGDSVGDKVTGKIDEAGGPSGILKDTVKGVLPFGGGSAGKQDTEGVGKGRRMPIQQQWDIGLPLETVYNQWTQFEEWPKFMHRVTRVTQEDDCTVSFSVKIWGKTKEFTAQIETQRPNDRIKWKTTQGMNHTGVVVFRELGPNLTRVMLSFDVAPGGLVEKYARGTRHIKRAARADFHRLVAFIEMLENETGAWRGVIEEGELVEEHDPKYDEKREYASADEIVHGRDSEDEDEDEEDEEDEDEDKSESDEKPRARSRRSANGRQSSESTRSGGSASRAQSRSSGSSSRGRSTSKSSGRSASSKSSSSRASSGRSSGKSSGRSSSSKSSSSRSSSGRSSGGRSRSSSGGSRSSSEHQGRQRSRSSRRS